MAKFLESVSKESISSTGILLYSPGHKASERLLAIESPQVNTIDIDKVFDQIPIYALRKIDDTVRSTNKYEKMNDIFSCEEDIMDCYVTHLDTLYSPRAERVRKYYRKIYPIDYQSFYRQDMTFLIEEKWRDDNRRYRGGYLMPRQIGY